MTYTGLVTLGGAELANDERLQAYAANGLVSPDTRLDLDVCEGLAALVLGDTPYRSPQQDDPPWRDDDDTDSYDFAGVLVLELTGVDSTTRTVDVTPLVGGGAQAGAPQWSPRVVAGTALLLGTTTAGVLYGLGWLTRLLQGGCDDLDGCAEGAALQVLTTCPTVQATADLDSPPLTATVTDPNGGGDPQAWQAIDATFATPDGASTVLSPYNLATIYDGGVADEDIDDTIDGGDVDPLLDLIEGGSAYTPVTAYLAGLPRACTDGPVTIAWSLRHPTDGEASPTQLVLLGPDGAVTTTGPDLDLTDTLVTYTWDLPLGVELDNWRPALQAQGEVVVESVTVTWQPDADLIDCITPYLRTLPGAVCVAGPNPVETIDGGCAELLRVEWTWTLTSAHRYGPTTELLAGLTADTDATFTATAVDWERVHTSAGAAAEPTYFCPTPPPPASSCAVDPGSPTFAPGPALPSIVSPNIVTIDDTDLVRRYTVLVQPDHVPAGDGLFTIRLEAVGGPVVGARVRVYDNTDADGLVTDPCDFAYEYLIDYVPAGGVLTLGGPLEQVATLCDGASRYSDATGTVRGPYGGPVVLPHARCDNRYLLVVDQLDHYPRTVPGVYTNGTEQPPLRLALAVTPRDA